MLNRVKYIAFDFDGVFTDNKVYVNSLGDEFVRCDRADGLGLNMLRKHFKMRGLDVDMYILSTEKNNVVLARASKLGLQAYNGIDSKLDFLVERHKESVDEAQNKIKGLLYIGNDLNDLAGMKAAEFTACPNDAHPLVKQVSCLTVDRNGGDGFVRELIEELIKTNGGDLIKCME